MDGRRRRGVEVGRELEVIDGRWESLSVLGQESVVKDGRRQSVRSVGGLSLRSIIFLISATTTEHVEAHIQSKSTCTRYCIQVYSHIHLFVQVHMYTLLYTCIFIHSLFLFVNGERLVRSEQAELRRSCSEMGNEIPEIIEEGKRTAGNVGRGRECQAFDGFSMSGGNMNFTAGSQKFSQMDDFGSNLNILREYCQVGFNT